MDSPLISIIIPVYNAEQYLQRCLDSVVNQTYRNLEIICIDDGSTDSSGVICDDNAEKDSRIRVVHQHNKGISAARNKGLDIARGEYIAFIDSDDYVKEGMIETLYDELRLSCALYAICGYSCVDANGKLTSTHCVDRSTQYLGTEALNRHYYFSNGQENFVTVWGKLFGRELFSNLRFKENIYFEDIQLMPYLLLKAEKVVLIPYTGYYYSHNENSITNMQNEDHKAQLYRNSFEIWEEHIALFRAKGLTDLENAVRCACVDKVIAHSLTTSIPAGMEKKSLKLAHQYTRILLLKRIPLKQKLYYMLFVIIGVKNFKTVMDKRYSRLES